MRSFLLTSRLFALISVCLFASCEKDNLLLNQAPDTHMSVEAINLSGNNRLNSTVSLSWYGTDIDGYITGFEFSVNGGEWIYTETRDSLFRFPIAPGEDTTDVIFRVRAIDDDGQKDESPAELIVPLKNAPPVAEIESVSFPKDTCHLALTFRWKYSDPDGNQTVTGAYLKLNNGPWTEIDRNKPLITLVSVNPEVTGPVSSHLYYNTESQPSSVSLSGFVNGGDNIIYLKVKDIAGTESIVDTATTVYVKPKKHPMLMISGQSPQINQFYRNQIAMTGNSFDFIDLNTGGGKYMPYFWNPTFSTLVKHYDVLFLNSDQGLLTNPSNGNSGLLLEFMAPVMQTFTDNGGKSFITTSFPPAHDLSLMRGVYPIDSLSATSGQAVIQKDSNIYDPAGKFPSISPQNLLLGMDPMVPAVDAKVIYKARLTPFGAWKGPDVVGVTRSFAGKTRQVFFSVELHQFTQNISSLNSLFDQMLNQELK